MRHHTVHSRGEEELGPEARVVVVGGGGGGGGRGGGRGGG
eukprot:SAG31_NODE_7740_length_1605_cov_3.241036_1_plen_39_part_10